MKSTTSLAFAACALVVFSNTSCDATIDALPVGRQLRVDQPKERLTIDGHDAKVSCVGFSPDGSLLASASHRGTLLLWDVKSGERRALIELQKNPYYCLAFSKDGKNLALGTIGATELFDIAANNIALTFPKTSKNALAFSPDGRILAVGRHLGISFWDLESKRLSSNVDGYFGEVHSVAFSKDGALLACGGMDADVKLLDGRTFDLKAAFPVKVDKNDAVWCVAFNESATLLASGSSGKSNNAIRVWDTGTGKEKVVLAGHDKGTLAIAFLSDNLLASGGRDGMLRLWDLKTGKEVAALQAHKGYVRSIAFCSTGNLLASGGDDGKVKLWDIPRVPNRADAPPKLRSR